MFLCFLPSDRAGGVRSRLPAVPSAPRATRTMDLNSDSDEEETAPLALGAQAGEVHDEDQREFQQTHAPNAARRSEQLESQQRAPWLGAQGGSTERAPAQNVSASLAGTSTGGANGPVPDFVQRLLAEELKEWTLAQGERLGNSAQQLDYATRLKTLAQLPCGFDDPVHNHWNRPQEFSNNHRAATAEPWPPQQGARTQAQRWEAAEGWQGVTNPAVRNTASFATSIAVVGVDDEDELTNAGSRCPQEAARPMDTAATVAASLAAHVPLCASLGRPVSPRMPSQNRFEWTSAEDELICDGVQRLGCKWRVIAAQLPGRSDDAVRNRWNRQQESMRPPGEAQVMCSRGCGQRFAQGPARLHNEMTCSGGCNPARGFAASAAAASTTVNGGGSGGAAQAAAAAHTRTGEKSQDKIKERTAWTRAEDDKILHSVIELGCKWSKIGRLLPTRHRSLSETRLGRPLLQ